MCLVVESCPTLCGLWTVAWQAPLSIGLFMQEYWSRLPFPSAWNLPNEMSVEMRCISTLREEVASIIVWHHQSQFFLGQE